MEKLMAEMFMLITCSHSIDRGNYGEESDPSDISK